MTVGDQGYRFPVKTVSPEFILAGDHTLIPTNGVWQVQNYSIPHSVNFLIGSRQHLFTGVPEMDHKILLRMDYDSLRNSCMSNPEINLICQDEYFWKLKIEHDFGYAIQEMILNILRFKCHVAFLMRLIMNSRISATFNFVHNERNCILVVFVAITQKSTIFNFMIRTFHLSTNN